MLSLGWLSGRLQRSALQEQVRAVGLSFADAEWIVVADEYPPNVIGGAEVSLHETLSSDPAFCARGFVVKFSDTVECVSHYRFGGVEVVVIPKQPGPLHAFSSTKRFDRLLGRFAPSIVAEGIRVIGLFMCFGERARRLRVVRLRLASRQPSGGILTDGLPEAHHLHATSLNTLVQSVSPRTVLANNTRSIMAAARAVELDRAAWSGVRRIAAVRDNRFFCVRHNQIARVGGRDCVRCDFACAAEDAPGSAPIQREILDDVAQARRAALSTFHEVTVTSRFLRSQLARLTAAGTKVRLVPNFAQAEVADQARTVSQAKRDVVLVIGSLTEAKGQIEFVESAPDILQENPALDIWLAGRGDRMKANIEKIVAKHGIEERVRFCGFLDRPELYAAIRQSKVVALPTLWPEPFGRVPLEAALCERPVVSFATGGLVELIEHGKTGLLVSKADYGTLWEEILGLIRAPERAEAMALRARAALGATYSETRAREAFFELFERR